METTLFAQPTAGPEAIAARLRRDLGREAAAAGRGEGELARLAEASVATLWGASRVKAFVPLLALRAARDALRAGGGARDPAPAGAPRGPAPARRDEDVLALDP